MVISFIAISPSEASFFMQRKKTSPNDPSDWFSFAEDRLRTADLVREHEGITPSGIECLQEAVERYLKGYLIAQGWSLQKTHDLERLVRDAVTYEPAFAGFGKMAIELTEEFFAQHYPGGDLTTFGQNYDSLRSEVTALIDLIKLKSPSYFLTK